MNDQLIHMLALAGHFTWVLLAILWWRSNRIQSDKRSKLDNGKEQLQAELEQSKTAFHQLELESQERESQLSTQLQVSQMRSQEQQRHHQELNRELQLSQQQLQKEFEALSAKIFEESRKKFEDQSKKALDSSLSPLKKEIENFRSRVDQVHSVDLADRNKLKGQIEALQKQAQQIGQDAVQLASVLKGENKSQGNWGEMILERLLEDSGLEKGREYQTQVSATDEGGKRRNPDIIVHLPDNKDLIIDSKVSLIAYDRYFNASSDEERDAALKDHLASVKRHFAGLSKKSYESLDGIQSLDFVFMFVAVEPAYLVALQSDPSLFQQAYNQGVILVAPTTLMATLRTVANLWRNEKQNRNAQEIAESAGGLYDQFVLLLESFDEVASKLDSTQKSFEKARNRLGEGRGNLIRRVENLRKLGAKAKKRLPDSTRQMLEE